MKILVYLYDESGKEKEVKLPPPEAVALLCSHLEGAFEVRVVSVV